MSKYSKKNVIIEGNKLMMRKNAFYVLVVSFLMQINILFEYWLTIDDFIDTNICIYLFWLLNKHCEMSTYTTKFKWLLCAEKLSF